MSPREMRHDSAASKPSRVSLHLAGEVRYIQHRAIEHDGRVVSIGPLVLFSTETGDAWILEPANNLATKVASHAEALPIHIEESESKFAIGWRGHYRLEGDTFVYEDNESGGLVVIRGYPVGHIVRAINQAARA